jgi:Flp pilus assembly pilin Flp
VKLPTLFERVFTGEDGATVVEYALMLALIALICAAGVSQIGTIDSLFFSVANTL